MIWVPIKTEDNKDCKTGKHSKDCTFTMSIIDDLNVTCDEIIDTHQSSISNRVCLLLLQVITNKYYAKRRSATPNE